MVRIRQGWLVALGLGVGLGLFTACKKDDKAGTSGDQAGDKAGAASDDLSLLPVDSEVVLGINIEQLMNNPMVKKFIEPMLKSGAAQARLAEVTAKCGFDPMMAVKSVVVGVKGAGGNQPTAVIVAHGLDKAKDLECFEKTKDEAVKDGDEVTRTGDILTIKGKRGQVAIAFTSDTTAVMLVSDTADVPAVKAVIAGNSGLKTSPAFLDMYKKLKTTDSVWAIANGKVLDGLPVKATAAFGSLNLTDGVTVDGRMRFDTPEAAAQAAELIKGQGKQAAAYVDKMDATVEGTEVHSSVVVSNQKLQSLMPLLTMVFGGLGQ
ncbi:MAG: hypothetical protein E6J90_08210 [Deltaproteobacteria bacterium]|nr:MAG: hypothetical protein E6J91_33050 [Deltaproteobacteria bacterium]TMQ24332.1 MAG: hypothetical protein E6J90_08210 [Deltaproteobacteria bacterium]